MISPALPIFILLARHSSSYRHIFDKFYNLTQTYNPNIALFSLYYRVARRYCPYMYKNYKEISFPVITS
jgi:hypothetical protein